MKISYDEKPDRREPIAYLKGGTLFFRATIREASAVHVSGAFCDVPGVSTIRNWAPDDPDITHRFYAGDTITLTF